MIQLYRDFEITVSSDGNSYVLRRLRTVREGKRRGETDKTLVGYFNALDGAVRRIADAYGNEASDLRAWLDEYKRVFNDFEELLT